MAVDSVAFLQILRIGMHRMLYNKVNVVGIVTFDLIGLHPINHINAYY